MKTLLDIQKEVDAYFLALGRFIHEFSQLEARLQYLLWWTTGVDVVTAKAIFSGTRIEGCTSFIRRLREARKDEPSAYLDKAFLQIPIITNLRNDIVHYGAEFDNDDLTPTVNTIRAHQEGSERRVPVPPAVLDNAREDLRTIIACLNQHELKQFHNPAWGVPHWLVVADRAWLYKPTQPSGQKSRKSGKTPKPSRPQQPSAG